MAMNKKAIKVINMWANLHEYSLYKTIIISVGLYVQMCSCMCVCAYILYLYLYLDVGARDADRDRENIKIQKQ